MINVTLTITAQMDLYPLHLEKTVVAGAVYLQEGDRYELWSGGELAEVTEVTWAHDFQRVRVCLSGLDPSFVLAARDNGWTVRGQATSRSTENPYTWRTVPLGYLVPGRGYVSNKVSLLAHGQREQIEVQFVRGEPALLDDRYALTLDPDQEITNGNSD